MVAANELRIGNKFIRELYTSRGLEYDHDFILTEEWMGRLFSDYTAIALNDLYVIPLTPEILTNCNFKFKLGGISGADMWQGMSFWRMDDLTLRGNISTANGGVLHLEGYFNCQIRYLHQLQNLYFALTGEELEIKL